MVTDCIAKKSFDSRIKVVNLILESCVCDESTVKKAFNNKSSGNDNLSVVCEGTRIEGGSIIEELTLSCSNRVEHFTAFGKLIYEITSDKFRILIEQKDMKNSLESKLQIDSICSFRILSIPAVKLQNSQLSEVMLINDSE